MVGLVRKVLGRAGDAVSVQEAGSCFGWRGRLLLGLLLVALLLPRADTVYLTPAKLVAKDYLFSIELWEVSSFPRKWLHLVWQSLRFQRPSREQRLDTLEEYLTLARMARKEKDRLEGLLARRGATLAPTGNASEESLAASREYLRELLEDKEELRAEAEEAMEAEVSAVLAQQGLDSRLGLLFPPVDMRFGQPPTILVTSPRDRIQLWEAVLLDAELPLLERDKLEQEVLRRYNFSALVDNLAGLATYPAIINDLYPTRLVLQTAAHEWLHHYFFFRPLGRNMRSSPDMVVLNETAADLAGRELGDMAFVRMGGDLTESFRLYLPDEERDPDFTREMRTTRVKAEELLAEGKVDEAEQYLKERRWFLALRGYYIRKLNQAYFAFRGSYAESSASVSPIGDQLKEMRALLPSVGDFVRTVSGIASYQEFLDTLEQLRARSAAAPAPAP